MDRYEFLRAVLPAQGSGNYVAVFRKPGTDITWNRHCNTIEELADVCVTQSKNNLTAYFALGTFRDNLESRPDGGVKARRLATMAHEFKTFAVDIDCGSDKPYSTATEGAKALIEFLKVTALPLPIIVSSGNGIHAYWPLVSSIPAALWRKGGVALRALCKHHNLHVDESKVHDPSMVLRPLDTINVKGGREVKLLKEAPLVGAEALFRAFIAAMPQTGSATNSLPKPIRMTERMLLNEATLAAESKSYPAPVVEKIEQNCAQFALLAQTGGANAGYNLWWYSCGLAKFTTTPEEAIARWAGKYEGFSLEANIKKMESWSQNPPTCSKIDAENPGVCSKCPHWQRVGSPARVGAPDPEPLPASTATVASAPAPDGTPIAIDPLVTAPLIEPPAPFRRTAAGIQVEVNGIWVHICAYDLFPSHVVRDPQMGYDMVEWVWNKPHVGYTRMRVRASFIFNDSSIIDLNSAMADNGFFVETKTKQAWLGAYMRAYVQQLQKQQASIDLYESFGWKDNYKRFVIGNVELRRENTGEVTAHEVGVSKVIAAKKFDQTFSAKGNLALWSEWTKALDSKEMAVHQIELARGFASPLLEFTGLRGFVFSLLGESGLGKSTMQNWAASIYGMPLKVNTTANDTQMAITQRMGIWNNLPLGIDEVTKAKPELVANFMYWGTQGQDRNRVSETNQANSWALAISMSSNRSVRDKVSITGADVDAIHMRLLEFVFHKTKLFSEGLDYGRRIGLMLEENYGLAGRKYIAHLLSLGPEKIREDIELRYHYVKKKYGFEFEQKERFWQVAVVLCDLGAYYAKQLGLIKYDFTYGTKEMLSQILSQRTIVSGSQLDTYDLIADYINSFNGASLTLLYNNGSVLPQEPLPRGEVRIRKEIYFENNAKGLTGPPSRGFAMLDKTHFHHWVVSKGYDFKTVMDTLTVDQSGFRPGRNGRIYMGKDSPIKLPQCSAIGINLNHAKFKGMLSQFDSGNVVDINSTKGERNASNSPTLA